MILRPLRQNLVAYLALVVALGTGTAYAAEQIANGSITSKKLAKNSVTSSKIKKNAVKSADVKDGAVTAADLAPGVLPDTGVIEVTRVDTALTPVASPDQQGLEPKVFAMPRAGKVYVVFSIGSVGLNCSSGSATVGLYVDGAPIPGTGVGVSGVANPRHVELPAVISLSQGVHTFDWAYDCPTGDSLGGNALAPRTWTVMVLSD